MRASPDTPLRLGQTHGYRFDGDRVHLNAELQIANPAATAAGEWALQLWACDDDTADLPAGVKVAELPCRPDTAFDTAWIEATATALPPAGQGEHVMVLALARGHDGRFDTICDTARFPRPERFVQPRLVGSTGFGLDQHHVTVHADRVENPRSADNLSGSLSLELWALAAPYGAGEPAGTCLATAALGVLGGGQQLERMSFDLPLAARPAGTWHLALLLREWTGDGYATRDFSNFALPVSFPTEAAAPVAEVADEVKEAVAPAEAATSAVAPPAPAAKKPGARTRAAKATAPAGAVCINTASAAELAAVKGLPKTVAAAIVAARPFARLDDLLAVKGVGDKLLGKLRASLRV